MCYIQDQKDFFLLQKKFLALYIIAANLSLTPETPVELLLVFKRFGLELLRKAFKMNKQSAGRSGKEPCLPSSVLGLFSICVLNMQA